jgi:magnesium-transporting ATPase (P-type)
VAKLLPDKALRLTGGERTEEVPVAVLRPGGLLLTRPGASIPAGGVVKSGRSAVNEAMITGESQPVAKETGATVIAGATAQAARSRAQALADRAAFVLTIVAHRCRCVDVRRLARLRRDTRLHHHPRHHRPRHRLPDASSRSVAQRSG